MNSSLNEPHLGAEDVLRTNGVDAVARLIERVEQYNSRIFNGSGSEPQSESDIESHAAAAGAILSAQSDVEAAEQQYGRTKQAMMQCLEQLDASRAEIAAIKTELADFKATNIKLRDDVAAGHQEISNFKAQGFHRTHHHLKTQIAHLEEQQSSLHAAHKAAMEEISVSTATRAASELDTVVSRHRAEIGKHEVEKDALRKAHEAEKDALQKAHEADQEASYNTIALHNDKLQRERESVSEARRSASELDIVVSRYNAELGKLRERVEEKSATISALDGEVEMARRVADHNAEAAAQLERMLDVSMSAHRRQVELQHGIESRSKTAMKTDFYKVEAELTRDNDAAVSRLQKSHNESVRRLVEAEQRNRRLEAELNGYRHQTRRGK